MHPLFVVAAPGLEAIVAAEVAAILPGSAPTIEAGGVAVAADDLGLYALNLRLRAATRVLVRVGEFTAPSFAVLHRRAGACPWERFLRPGQAIVVRASAERSRLYHTGGIAERIARGIGDRLGVAPALVRASDDDEREDDAALIVARVARDRCTLSVDASGEALSRRGYRQATAKAPLRESLAAGILLAVAEAGEAIVDPMCGSGTFPIEAALRALRIAPGLRRRFAFMGWPGFAGDAQGEGAWEGLVAAARSEGRAAAPAPIGASDRDPGAIAAAQANAARAGVDGVITITRAELAEARAPCERGLVVMNPPYGVRIGERRGLARRYAALGEALRRGFAGAGLAWRAAILAPAGGLARETGLELAPRLRLKNGGIAVELWVGPIG
ncbi:MAG: hypothetical protein R3B09_31365 [Nannocystaceae bacterium]